MSIPKWIGEVFITRDNPPAFDVEVYGQFELIDESGGSVLPTWIECKLTSNGWVRLCEKTGEFIPSKVPVLWGEAAGK